MTSAIDNSQTTLVVASASAFPTTGNFRIIIESEILKVTSVSSNTFTVTRGQEGTTAASHSSGMNVTAILTKEAMNQFRADNFTLSTVSARPSAGVPGRLYLPSDGNGSIGYDDGSNWKPFGLFFFPLTTPVASNFSSVGSGGATFTQNGDSVVGLQAGNKNTGFFKTVTPPVTVTVQLTPQYVPTASGVAMVGMAIRDSSTGNTISFGFSTNAGTRAFTITKFTGASSFGSPTNSLSFANSNFPEVPRWQRIIQPTSGNREYYFSVDGQNWILYLSEAFNTHAASVNQAGFLWYSDATHNGAVNFFLRSYKET